MRHRVIDNSGPWKVLAPVSVDGTCEVQEAIEGLAKDRKTRTTALGFLAQFARITHVGPRSLGTDKFHRVDDANEIDEFIKRDHRILCFQADGALIVCSHVMRKRSSKTPARDRKRAAELRRQYLQDIGTGDIEVEPTAS